MSKTHFGSIALVVCVSAAVAGLAARQGGQPQVRYSSKVMIFDMATKSSTQVHQADAIWEAPNWSRDGKYLLANSGGMLYRIPVDGASAPAAINLDPSIRANNDHDFSFDGKWLAISASAPGVSGSQVFVANADGTNHRALVTAPAAYFHGWSPDGKYLSFVGCRNRQPCDLFRVPFAGGPEERLTSDPAYDDGTDYSPDGKWIYFNSDRGGHWRIWRMPATGAGPDDKLAEMVTNDTLEDWFPHPSPDGKTLLYLSFPNGTKTHNDRNLQVHLRTIPMPGDRLQPAKPTTILTLTGGQGTINVNSWSPDSKKFGYVTYAEIK